MPVVPASLRRPLSAVLAALVGVLLLSGCGAGASGSVASSATAPVAGGKASASPSDAGTLAPASATTGLATVAVSALPTQAVDTLRLIRDGGPFPYTKDGVTFSNREGILPAHKSGWYQEYTVITPGSSDRGARRIITGKDGSRFYTDDHYASFHEVVSGTGG